MADKEGRVKSKKSSKKARVGKLTYLIGVIVALSVSMIYVNKVTVVPERRMCFSQDVCVWVKVADTDSERGKGLSGKLWMQENVGMIFLMETPRYHGFWMKEMKMGLDFVWLKRSEPTSSGYGEARVVDVTERVVRPREKGDELAVYRPREPADIVLEVNQGWAGRKGIRVGDTLSY